MKRRPYVWCSPVPMYYFLLRAKEMESTEHLWKLVAKHVKLLIRCHSKRRKKINTHQLHVGSQVNGTIIFDGQDSILRDHNRHHFTTTDTTKKGVAFVMKYIYIYIWGIAIAEVICTNIQVGLGCLPLSSMHTLYNQSEWWESVVGKETQTSRGPDQMYVGYDLG